MCLWCYFGQKYVVYDECFYDSGTGPFSYGNYVTAGVDFDLSFLPEEPVSIMLEWTISAKPDTFSSSKYQGYVALNEIETW